jgi:UDP-N-acetylmuramoylalanine--D-glutamate ligase
MSLLYNLILGSGETSKAVSEFYKTYYPKQKLIIFDSRINNSNINFNINYKTNINRIILSPGINPNNQIINNLINNIKNHNPKVDILSEMELFLQHAKAPVIAITGTNGKSSVCKLIYDMLINCNKKALLGGNFSPPAISLLNKKNSDFYIPDFYIIEVSSFQLYQTPNFRSYISCLLNITPDHLDYHNNLTDYINSKLRIINNCEYAITPDLNISNKYNINNNNFYKIKSLPKSTQDQDANIIAALKIAKLLDLPEDICQKTIDTTQNLPHRYQVIKKDNLIYINDSKATNIGSVISAIKITQNNYQNNYKNKITLILGGDHKNQDFNILKDFLINNKIKIKAICLIGNKQNQNYLNKIFNKNFNIFLSDNLINACNISKSLANNGDVILLSPACSSLDEYNNYAHRGDLFIDEIAST